jgi:iron(III) transport system permease protein
VPVTSELRQGASGSRGFTVAAAVLAGLVLLPLVAVAWNALTPRVEVWQHLARTQLPELTSGTIRLLAGVGLLAGTIGTGLAWLVATREFPGRSVFSWALVLPLAVPAYVIGFVFLSLFDYGGPVARGWQAVAGPEARLPEVRSWWGIVAVMSLVYYPYIYLLARNAFAERSTALLEAARSLGLGPWTAFRRLALPMARPALAAGLALALMETLADFGTVSLFGYPAFTVSVYRVWFGMFDRVAAGQLATVLLLFAGLLLALERWGRRAASFAGPSTGVAQRTVMSRGHGWAATALCALVVGVAFLLPAGVLVLWSLRAMEAGVAWDGLGRLAGNTGMIAALTAVLCVGAGILLGYATRLEHGRALSRLVHVSLLGYAIPGSVVAVGVLGVLAAVDRAIGAGTGGLGLPDVPLLATSVVGLLFAYLVRFLAVAWLPVQAGLLRLPVALDESARALGAGPGRILRVIHAPLMRGAILTASTLVLLDVMKEMPATMLLRPFGFDTLAVGIWQATTESLWLQAAPPALAIVAVGGVLVGLLSRALGAALPSGTEVASA